MTDRLLMRHLAVAVLLKVLVLALLWWLFVRDSRVAVDGPAAAQHLAAPSPAAPTTTGAR